MQNSWQSLVINQLGNILVKLVRVEEIGSITCSRDECRLTLGPIGDFKILAKACILKSPIGPRVKRHSSREQVMDPLYHHNHYHCHYQTLSDLLHYTVYSRPEASKEAYGH